MVEYYSVVKSELLIHTSTDETEKHCAQEKQPELRRLPTAVPCMGHSYKGNPT